ncbi:hypothetical protein A7X12_08080 [Sphingomonas sp. TDK1]|nr:hypothetical protein A7X12_08080 [Sphingomonas sp. TDK1]
MPALVLAAHVHLHESTGQVILLPGCGTFARPQAHGHLPVDPGGLARLQRDLALDAVTLVQHAQHCDTIAHRRRRRIHGGGIGPHGNGVDALIVAGAGNHQLVAGIVAAGSTVAASATRTTGQREREQRRRSLHASGVQAS